MARPAKINPSTPGHFCHISGVKGKGLDLGVGPKAGVSRIKFCFFAAPIVTEIR